MSVIIVMAGMFVPAWTGRCLKVAVTMLSEPRCFIKDGEITGMNVELMDRIAYELGMRAEYQDAAMVESLYSGKSDVIAAMYKTPSASILPQVTFQTRRCS